MMKTMMHADYIYIGFVAHSNDLTIDPIAAYCTIAHSPRAAFNSLITHRH